MNIFVGVPQSKYAGMAILISLVFVAFAMIFGKDQVPVGQKFLFVLIMFVVSLPSILFLLFQLTCLVTGAGAKNQRWWCAAYAWIGTIFVIIYSVIIVLIGVMSLVNGTSVSKDINNIMSFEQMKDLADNQAREYFTAQGGSSSSPTHQPPMPTAKPPDAFANGSPSHKTPDHFQNGGSAAATMSIEEQKDRFTVPNKPEGFTGSSVSNALQKFVNGRESFIDIPQPEPKEGNDQMAQHAVPQPAGTVKTENFALLSSLLPH